jgi:hypothetical protein
MTGSKKIIILSFFISVCQLLNGQTINTITTAVPFVTINSNAQSMGSGWVGVVASDLYMQNGLDQNPALLSRGRKVLGFQLINYVPWLRALVPDINLVETGYYQSFGNHAIGFSARNFSLGEITFTDNVGNVIGTFKPNEFYYNLKYALNFSEGFSMGCGIKYIRSNLTGGIAVEGAATTPANALAGDLGFDFRRNLVQTENFKFRWNVGLAFLNIGNKVSYTANSEKDFIPQTMKLGTLFTLRWRIKNNNYVACDFSYQADKLLVPTPPILARDFSGNPIPDGNGYYVIQDGMNPNVSSLEGIIQSFYDAPGGGSEEMREIVHQFGTESRLSLADNRILIALRGGYFSEHETKGNRKFATFGLGFGFSGFRLDFANLFPLENRHPLENTFSLSIGARFNIGDDNFFRFKEQ